MPILSVTEMIRMYRADAKNHRTLADQLDAKAASLERDLAVYGIKDGIATASGRAPEQPSRPPPSLEDLRGAIREKGMRATNLSMHFGIPLKTIQEMIERPNSGIRDKGRGWLEVCEDNGNFDPASPDGLRPETEEDTM